MKKKLSLLFVVFFISLSNIAIQAQETVNKKNEVKLFRHGSDNQFDVSNFLNSTVGFLPVPILITEPAVGYGGGAFLAYFHKKKTR